MIIVLLGLGKTGIRIQQIIYGPVLKFSYTKSKSFLKAKLRLYHNVLVDSWFMIHLWVGYESYEVMIHVP